VLEHDLSTIQPGWDVFGSDGEKVGSVKGSTDAHVIVEKGLLLKQDLYVPHSHVAGIGEENITLSVAKSEVDSMDWSEPGTGSVEPTDGGSPSEDDSSDEPASRPADTGAYDPRAPESRGADTTTMTGAGFGAGAGPAAAGSLGAFSGPDAQTDRFGGAGRGGTSDLAPPPEDQLTSEDEPKPEERR